MLKALIYSYKSLIAKENYCHVNMDACCSGSLMKSCVAAKVSVLHLWNLTVSFFILGAPVLNSLICTIHPKFKTNTFDK